MVGPRLGTRGVICGRSSRRVEVFGVKAEEVTVIGTALMKVSMMREEAGGRGGERRGE